MGCLADNAKEHERARGRHPLAERGRLVDSAKGMYEMPRGQRQRAWENPLAVRGRLVVSAKTACDCEKAGTHWLNVGAS